MTAYPFAYARGAALLERWILLHDGVTPDRLLAELG